MVILNASTLYLIGKKGGGDYMPCLNVFLLSLWIFYFLSQSFIVLFFYCISYIWIYWFCLIIIIIWYLLYLLIYLLLILFINLLILFLLFSLSSCSYSHIWTLLYSSLWSLQLLSMTADIRNTFAKFVHLCVLRSERL